MINVLEESRSEYEKKIYKVKKRWWAFHAALQAFLFTFIHFGIYGFLVLIFSSMMNGKQHETILLEIGIAGALILFWLFFIFFYLKWNLEYIFSRIAILNDPEWYSFMEMYRKGELEEEVRKGNI